MVRMKRHVTCRGVIQTHYSQKALIGAAEPQFSHPIRKKQLGKCCKFQLSWTVCAALTSTLCLYLPFASQTETWVLVVMSIEVLIILRGLGRAEGSESDSDDLTFGISLFKHVQGCCFRCLLLISMCEIEIFAFLFVPSSFCWIPLIALNSTHWSVWVYISDPPLWKLSRNSLQ